MHVSNSFCSLWRCKAFLAIYELFPFFANCGLKQSCSQTTQIQCLIIILSPRTFNVCSIWITGTINASMHTCILCWTVTSICQGFAEQQSFNMSGFFICMPYLTLQWFPRKTRCISRERRNILRETRQGMDGSLLFSGTVITSLIILQQKLKTLLTNGQEEGKKAESQ